MKSRTPAKKFLDVLKDIMKKSPRTETVGIKNNRYTGYTRTGKWNCYILAIAWIWRRRLLKLNMALIPRYFIMEKFLS